MSLTGYYDTSYPPSLWAPTPPTLASLNPNTGVTGTSLSLTVTGTKFTADSVVKFGATSLATTFVSPTQLTATMAALPAAGTVQVTVTNTEGTSNARPFTVTATQEEMTEPAGFTATIVDPSEIPPTEEV